MVSGLGMKRGAKAQLLHLNNDDNNHSDNDYDNNSTKIIITIMMNES